MERIEGFFANIKRANETADKLKKAGFRDVVTDINDHYIDERNVRTNLPGTEASPSLSGLVLKSGMTAADRSKGPLTAASPMVSGIGDFDEIADFNCRIVVQAEKEDAGKAKEIIKSMGGALETPNVEIPKGLQNVDI